MTTTQTELELYKHHWTQKLVPETEELAEFQTRAVERCINMLKDWKGMILGSDMGLGKSIQCAALINHYEPERCLIVCSANGLGMWFGMLPRWLLKKRKVQLLKKTKDILQPDSEIVIVSYNLVYRVPILRQLLQFTWPLAIYDEAHKLSNLDTNYTKSCLGNLWKVVERVVFSTGSVQRDKVIDLYPMCKRIAPALFPGDYWAFARNYCHIERSRFGAKAIGGKNLDKLQAKIKTFMVRDKKDKVSQLPDKLTKKIYIECELPEELDPDEQARKDFEEKIEKEVNENKESGESARLRLALGICKIPGVHEHAKLWFTEHQKQLVMFCRHISVWEQYLELFKKDFKCVGIKGGDSERDRTRATGQFESGKADLFLASFAAAECITLVAASTLMYAELSWSLDQMEQSADRVHRMGQLSQVYIQYLLADTPLDDVVYNSYKQKARIKKRTVG